MYSLPPCWRVKRDSLPAWITNTHNLMFTLKPSKSTGSTYWPSAVTAGTAFWFIKDFLFVKYTLLVYVQV